MGAVRGEAVADESQPLQNVTRITEEKYNARRGLAAGMKVIGQVFLQRETHTVHYTGKRKVCARLKPI